ncbi:hypothetical protein ACTFIV_003599 [Dictyostelium citrinum]
MKFFFHFFSILILLLIHKSNIVKSDDATCLNNLIQSFFGVNSIQTCTGGSEISGPDGLFKYNVVCSNDGVYNIKQLDIINNGTITNHSLIYSDFNCFSGSLLTLKLGGLSIKADAFGTEMQTKVAQTIELISCTFPDGRFSSIGNTLPKNTNFFTINLYDNSNLKFVDFYSIKYLTNFYLTLNNLNVEVPTYSNSLQSSDIPNLSNMAISLKNIPSFANLKVSSLKLSLVGNSFSQAELLNLGTLKVLYLLFVKETIEMEYPNSISSIVSISTLTIQGNFTASSIGYSLPSTLKKLSIIAAPSFNINGKFPFVGILPSSLTSIDIGSIGVDTFPENFPLNIEELNFNYNPLDPPTNLPDLSSFSNLKQVSLKSNQFTGPIPNSYCFFRVQLNGNNLTGDWPQCKICFPNENVGNLDDNPLLNRGTCYPGSVVPNLDYDSSLKFLELYGENLGLTPPTVGVSLPFLVIIPNSRFGFSWDEGLLGPVPDMVNIQISSNLYTMPTKYSTPAIYYITKTGNNYTFSGAHFSYNKNDFIIKISGVDCVLSYIEYGTIICSNINPVPLGSYVSATMQNKKSTEVVSFYLNTVENKTSAFAKCSTNCNEPLGNGRCNTTAGSCKCINEYTGHDCSIPNQFITSVSPVPITGGVVNIWGWFGTSNEELSIKIGQQICTYHFISSDFINCTLDAGSGTQSITLTQNGITYTGINMFHYTELTYSCPKDCSNNGKCNTATGQCKCNSGWAGFDCNSKSSTGGNSGTTTVSPIPTSTPEIEIPKSNTTINGTDGSAVINNEQTTYEISILSLIETDLSNNIVNTYNLSRKWDPVNISANNIYKFTQTIQQSCIITYTIEEIKTARDYQFAGLDLTLDKDSIKISVSIKNYTFNSVLNNLQLRFESLVGDNNNNNNQENNQCNNKDTEVDTSEIDKNQLLNYVTISRNQKVLYGRFINRAISDSRQTFITTSVISNDSNNKQSVIIGLNLPHCTNECLIDPDFSVLVSSSYQKCSSGSNNGNNGRASWVLPVAIVVPCVGLVLIIIVSVILYKKNRLVFLVAKSKMKGLKLKVVSK